MYASSPQRALVAVGAGYGNIVMATPTIAAVRALGYRVDVFVESHQPQAASLISGWAAVETIHLNRRTLRRQAGLRLYDVVVRTVWNRGAPLGVGPEVSPDPLPLREHPEVLLNLTAARALGYTGPVPSPHVEIEVPLLPLAEPHIAIAPGYGGVQRADWKRKEWPHWQEFCALCRDRLGLTVQILGAEEDGRGWMNADAERGLRNLCGRTFIRSAAGILSLARVIVAVDNGLAHIGAALGRPVLVLFGATSEIKNRPFGPRARVLTADVPCRPCQMTDRWGACADFRCMSTLGAETVFAALQHALEETCPTAAPC